MGKGHLCVPAQKNEKKTNRLKEGARPAVLHLIDALGKEPLHLLDAKSFLGFFVAKSENRSGKNEKLGNLEFMERFKIYHILKIRVYLCGEPDPKRPSQEMREDVESGMKIGGFHKWGYPKWIVYKGKSY